MNSLQRRGYSLGDVIGKGTFSKVVRACHEEGGKRIELACKIIDKEEADEKFITEFFPHELEVLAKLKHHPNLIGIHSILERKGVVYVFMRWAEKGDLRTWLIKNKKVTESQANFWFFQMVSAVKYLHSLGYAHRDIKPENIFLSTNLNVKIGDFGFVCCCEDKEKNIIFSETFCGSPAYAAPEILKCRRYNPKKVDIYALGAVLYTMLSGKFPYEMSNLKEARKCQKTQTLVDTAILDELSVQCVDMIYNLLTYDPEVRPDIETVYAMPWLRKRVKSQELK